MAKKTDDTFSKVLNAVIIIATAIISLVLIVCLKPKNPMKVVQYVAGAIATLGMAYIVGIILFAFRVYREYPNVSLDWPGRFDSQFRWSVFR